MSVSVSVVPVVLGVDSAAVNPFAAPVTVSATDPAKPLVRLTVMTTVAAPPWEGEASCKSPRCQFD
ncbi:MAG TPA: hypothetical protein VGH04_04135 [Gemmatimonadaceae bacterium]